MRKTVFLSTVILLLIAGMAVAISACGGSSTGSSTTLSTAGETSTTVTGDQTTTSTTGTGDTTSSTEAATTTTTQGVTTTTEAARTTDTADHAADFRAQYPSTASFDNSNWATLAASPGSYLGASVVVKGQPANVTVDPDSKYLTWQLTVSGTGGEKTTALCRTNVNVDRSLLSAGSPVEVKGIVAGVQDSDAGGGPIIYVETVQKAA